MPYPLSVFTKRQRLLFDENEVFTPLSIDPSTVKGTPDFAPKYNVIDASRLEQRPRPAN
jgi:hypothetical protein